MSDERVQLRTGKTWDRWFSALDKAEVTPLDHLAIAGLLSGEFGVPAW